jgi:hypothetical protein
MPAQNDWTNLTPPSANVATTKAFELPAHISPKMQARRLPLNKDGLLLFHQQIKNELDDAKALEMELRKLVVEAFVAPEVKKEGMNNVDLGNGYTLKATVQYNYNLKAAEGKDVVDECDNVIDDFARIANDGTFIAERLFKWQAPTFSVAEYRALVESAKTSEPHARLLKRLNDILEISEAAPTVVIKEPKVKR